MEVSMQERFRYAKAYPDAYTAMLALTHAVERTGLAPQLIDLINYRVSQLNGCAFCLDMHAKDLRARGEAEQRLYSAAFRCRRGDDPARQPLHRAGAASGRPAHPLRRGDGGVPTAVRQAGRGATADADVASEIPSKASPPTWLRSRPPTRTGWRRAVCPSCS